MLQNKACLKVASMRDKIAKMLFISFILWIISKKPVSGYDIIRMLKNEREHVCIGSAHIYPVLLSMQKNGLLSVRISKSGRRMKKTYSITRPGKTKIEEIKKMIFSDSLRAQFFREMVA